MTADTRLRPPAPDATMGHRRPWAETITSYEHELTELRRSEAALRAVVTFEDTLLRQRDEAIQLQEVLSKESDHRFLNSLQMIASLLSMQARGAANPETASQLGMAADRVVMIAAVHRRLHCLDGAHAVAFKPYLEELCGDISSMLGGEDCSDPIISVNAIEAELSSATGTSLGFIVSELVTNAAKHGKGQIKVRLEANGDKAYALSVSNGGPSLPGEFAPTKSKGLGMTIIRSLVAKIGGVLQFGPGDQGEGARFTVLFSQSPPANSHRRTDSLSPLDPSSQPAFAYSDRN